MSIDIPLEVAFGIATVVAIVRSVHIWRYGYRGYTDQEIQSGMNPSVRMKVMNGRATAVFPLAPFSVFTGYLAGSAIQPRDSHFQNNVCSVLLAISVGIFIVTGGLIFTLKNRAWPRRLIPPRFRTAWVDLSSL